MLTGREEKDVITVIKCKRQENFSFIVVTHFLVCTFRSVGQWLDKNEIYKYLFPFSNCNVPEGPEKILLFLVNI